MSASNAAFKTLPQSSGVPGSTTLAELRNLLLKESDQRVTELEASVAEANHYLYDSNKQLAVTSGVLVEAVKLLREQDAQLADALQPVVESSFHRSVRDDPNVLAESLYPVLGPAVRKMVMSLFTPEKSTGRLYKIDRIYVIHRKTSLLLNQTLVEATEAQDGDMVSGMLEAIRSFVRDAFEVHDFDGLDTLTIGDLTVWVEWGPEAIMAVVIRGVPPQALRQTIAQCLESIHVNYAEQLGNFAGDNNVFGSVSIELDMMVKSTHKTALRVFLTRWRIPALATLISMVLIGSVAYWLYVGRQWTALIDDLNTHPGIVVVTAQRGFNRYKISGMRDPLAADPARLLSSIDSRIDHTKIVSQWFPFKSLDDVMVDGRARQLLRLPVGVELTVFDDQMLVSGVANSEWIKNTLLLLPILENVLNKKIGFELTTE